MAVGVAEADLVEVDSPVVGLVEAVDMVYSGETCGPSKANTSYARYWHSDGQKA